MSGKNIIYLLSGMAVILMIVFYFLGPFKIKMGHIQQIYDSQGTLLSKCTMKNNLPWGGTFAKNTETTEQGTYTLDYYENGIIVKSLCFLNGNPAIGVLKKGKTKGTFKVKIQDKNKYKNSLPVKLSDSSNNEVYKSKTKNNGLLIVTDCLPAITYTVKILRGKKEYSLYVFEINNRGSVSLVEENRHNAIKSPIGIQEEPDKGKITK
jgi:hypothetical protein